MLLSIDDFGTGYSSLSRLHRFPIDTFKIDQSFVSRIGTELENPEIVRTIVTLARNLGMDVIAEGVETANQLEHLKDLGCDWGQGFFFAKPTDANGIVEWASDASSAPGENRTRSFADSLSASERLPSLSLINTSNPFSSLRAIVAKSGQVTAPETIRCPR